MKVAKPFKIPDIELKDFILRVQPSRVMSYIFQYANITPGSVNVMMPDSRVKRQKLEEHEMKKLIALTITFVFGFTLAACGAGVADVFVNIFKSGYYHMK